MSHLVDCQDVVLDKEDIRVILHDTVSALAHLHQNKVMHRDLKPPNLLVNKKGEVVISDFDLARKIPSPPLALTKNLVTRWYRAPELLYGSSSYDESVDIWALGCVMGELLLQRPLFPGEQEIDQLLKIFQLRGAMTAKNCPDCTKLPNYFEFENLPEKPLKSVLPMASP